MNSFTPPDPSGKGRWRPTIPGPQPENQIAPTFPEQLTRLSKPRPRLVKATRTRRVQALETRVEELERHLALTMLRQGRQRRGGVG